VFINSDHVASVYVDSDGGFLQTGVHVEEPGYEDNFTVWMGGIRTAGYGGRGAGDRIVEGFSTSMMCGRVTGGDPSSAVKTAQG
jgi:hypothetical protein